MKYVAGIDVGGTKTMICIMDTNKKIGHTAVFGTQSDRGPEELVCKIGVVLSHIASKAGISFTDICAIGLGMPGPIDFEKGAMINPPNFPGWNDVPLVKLMRKKFNKPIVLE
ncbi:MAG: ROK family protein, partial [Thermoanaerobacterales bacterium]|nr:ROK family protein [Thermoanaerobacterales bacterium]